MVDDSVPILYEQNIRKIIDMKILFCALLGYAFGNVNTAYILSKKQGFDIRTKGSGNAGASNVVLIMGRKAGMFTAVADILKAFFAVVIAGMLFADLPTAKELAGISCVLGHIFPVTMEFKGGKGLACMAGSVLAYSPKMFVVLLAIEAVVALVTDYVCLIPITGSILITILYARKYGINSIVGMMCVTIVVIVLKHMENLQRITKGLEVKISYLWKGDAEIDRVKANKELQNSEC